jgi:hypothetical protein
MPTAPGVVTPANSAEMVVRAASLKLTYRPVAFMRNRVRRALKAQLITISKKNKMAAHQGRRWSSSNCRKPPRKKGMARLRAMLATSRTSQDFFSPLVLVPDASAGLTSGGPASSSALEPMGGRGIYVFLKLSKFIIYYFFLHFFKNHMNL